MSDKTLTPQILGLYIGQQFKYTYEGIGYERPLDGMDVDCLEDYLDVKLTLRPLSSMTEEEGKKAIEIVYGIPDYPVRQYSFERVGQEEKNFHVSLHNDWWDLDLTFGNSKGSVWSTIDPARNTKIPPGLFLYLLSRGFDLFGLIDSGNALKKTV